MALTEAEQLDRFRGALLGLAIGDALGFPLRGIPPQSLRRLPPLAEDFAPRPRGRFQKGQFSDDTQLMLAVAESVLAEGKLEGRSAAAHLAWAWREGVLLYPPPSVAGAAQRLVSGMPWMGAGAPVGVRDASVLSRGLVVGLWQTEVLSRLPHDAGVATVITHKDPVCAAATAAYARAVSLALEGAPRTPTAFCEAAAIAAGVHAPAVADELRALPRLLLWDQDRALALLRRVGLPSTPDLEEGIPSHPLPVLLIALWAALRYEGDFRATLEPVLRLGGEVDACAALVGGLVGAHLGCSALPARLRGHLLYGAQLAETADRLLAVRLRAAAVAQTARRR